VGERDDYEKVVSWVNLDKLKENFLVNWTMFTAEQVRSDAAPINFIPIVYDLEPGHLKLYNQLVEEQLLELDNGQVIDALSASALYHKCQQIIHNWGVFADDESKEPAGVELVEEVLDEIGEEKLIIVANYRMTTTSLTQRLAKYGAAMLIGGLTDKQRYERVDRFTSDKACRVLIIQPEAGGVGLDGLQAVCNEMLFLECPTIPRQFEQAVARIAREGQQKQVNCRIAVANKTIQVRMHRGLLEKDDTIVKVTGGIKTLREAIHGD
jgi:SNF2 family DNA or RNA helicase